ncbi:MAG: tetratricopeptide repeat protein [Candidatus Omnitrophica bacterium]|nr:tetratricopeptide repeat protein [Candidatus Omnitrophota bacterium]
MKFRKFPQYFFGFILSLFLVVGGQSSSFAESVDADQERVAHALAAYTMGVIHDFMGNTPSAIEEFHKAAKYQDSYVIHLRLGADYARLGKLDESIAELQKVFLQDQKNAQAHYLLALIYSTQKKFDLAAKEYEILLTTFSEADPKNVEIYGYLAQLYYSQKDYPKAIQQFERILSLNPMDADVMFLLGSLYLETGNKEKAMELFSRAITANPEHDTCLNSLGYLYAEDGKNLDEAQQLIERALKIDPDNGAYLDSLGWVHYKKGQYAEALRYLKKAGSLLDDPVIYEHLGDVYFQLGQPDEAKQSWTKSLDLMPDQESVRTKLNSVD